MQFTLRVWHSMQSIASHSYRGLLNPQIRPSSQNR